MTEPLPLQRPEDILRFIAARLDELGEPFAVGREIDIGPLVEHGLVGEEAVRRSEIEDRVQRKLRWITNSYEIGNEVSLTERGAEAARQVYLPKNARHAIDELIAAGLVEDIRKLALEVMAWKSDATMMGGLNGSRYQVQLRELCREALVRRSELVLKTWSGLAEAQGYKISDVDIPEITVAVSAALGAGSPDVSALILRPTGVGRPLYTSSHLEALLQECESAFRARIRALALGLGSTGVVHSAAHTSVTISGGNIGAVQTGDRATAAITQNFQRGLGGDEIVKLLTKLEGILQEHAVVIAPRVREELSAAMQEGRVALEDPKGRRFALRGIAATLMNFTQTLAAIPGAADTLVQLAQALQLVAR